MRRAFLALFSISALLAVSSCTSIRPVVKVGLIAPFEGLYRETGYAALDAVRRHVPQTPHSEANFLWLPLGDRATDLAAACERNRVVVRAFTGAGVRVTVGTAAENDAFLAALDSWSRSAF